MNIIKDPVYGAEVAVYFGGSERASREAFMEWYVACGGPADTLVRDLVNRDPVDGLRRSHDGSSPLDMEEVPDDCACGYVPETGRVFGLWVGERCGAESVIERITAIAHEVSHVAVGVFSAIGIPVVAGNDEAFAYYMQFLLGAVLGLENGRLKMANGRGCNELECDCGGMFWHEGGGVWKCDKCGRIA